MIEVESKAWAHCFQANELQADLGSWIRTSGPEGLEHSLWSGAQCGCRALSYFCRVSIMIHEGNVWSGSYIFVGLPHVKQVFHCIYDKFCVCHTCIQLETAK